jgi:hypothetical protein
MSSGLERLRTAHTPDGGIVLDVESGKMFRLNPIGCQILCQLRKGASIPQVVEEIHQEYQVEVEIVREDLLHFFTTLEALGLLDRKVTDSNR